MADPTAFLAFMASQQMPDPVSAGSAPEWVQLLPTASGPVHTFDNRGPYLVRNAEAIISQSFTETDRIEIDVNHATFLAAPRGERADAVGWILEMQAREDGIWGRVEWTEEGAKLVGGKAYRKLSPVVRHDGQKQRERH